MCLFLLRFDYVPENVGHCSCSDKEMIAKIIRSLELKLSPVVADAKAHLQSLFNQWLPLSQAVLGKGWCFICTSLTARFIIAGSHSI